MIDFSPFWYWINERHCIYLAKEAGKPWPWTQDKILQTYAFCNVFRELDKVTIWIRKNWREPYADHPNLAFAMCVARQINWPESLEAIGFPGTFRLDNHKDNGKSCAMEVWKENAIHTLEYQQAQGHKIYTGAYMIRAEPSLPGQSKIRYTFDKVLWPVWLALSGQEGTKLPLNGSTIQGYTEYLEKFYGWGGFMAYESATDLRHTRYLKDAPDIMTWAQPGPGAQRGLNRLHGRDLKKPVRRAQAIQEMKELLEMSPKFLEPHVPALEMRDVEHSLCECDKMIRVKNGEGRPRAKYNPPR